MDKMPISAEGYFALKERLRILKEIERPAALDAVAKARELGDLSENADYKTAKDAQRNIDTEIRRLEAISDNSDVIDISALSGDAVMFGAAVELKDGNGMKRRYRILSEYESDPASCVIAITSPLARGLIGKKCGDRCLIKTPSGEKEFEILKVEYKWR
ncbi:MAG: transcription elongation factor GreA [Rickettsiales bacterium]|jgi:transcription elongation factor GreA|nr:transcription elongation factor GreA [Rickettsiales bacterium]